MLFMGFYDAGDSVSGVHESQLRTLIIPELYLLGGEFWLVVFVCFGGKFTYVTLNFWSSCLQMLGLQMHNYTEYF